MLCVSLLHALNWGMIYLWKTRHVTTPPTANTNPVNNITDQNNRKELKMAPTTQDSANGANHTIPNTDNARVTTRAYTTTTDPTTSAVLISVLLWRV